MNTQSLTFLLALTALAPFARADGENSPENPLTFDSKFVCDGQLKSGDKLQVSGRFIDGEMRDLYGMKGWQVDHVYVNGVRKPGDEKYNRNPSNAYFRASGKIGQAAGGLVPIGASLFAYKTMNDGAMDHLVIEYAGTKNPSNTMFLMNWDGAPESDILAKKYIARGANVQCRFFWIE